MKEQRQAGVSPGEAHQEGQSPVERTPEEKPRVIKGRFPWYSGQKEEASRQTHHRLCHEADSRGKGSARLPPGAGGSLSEGGGQAGPCPPGGRVANGPRAEVEGASMGPSQALIGGRPGEKVWRAPDNSPPGGRHGQESSQRSQDRQRFQLSKKVHSRVETSSLDAGPDHGTHGLPREGGRAWKVANQHGLAAQKDSTGRKGPGHTGC